MAEIDYAELIETVTNASPTLADVTGLVIDVPVAVNSEPIWIEFGCTAISNNAATGGGRIAIFEDSTKITTATWLDNDANSGVSITRKVRRTPTAGLHVYKVQLSTLFSGTVTLSADSDGDPGPAYITAYT